MQKEDVMTMTTLDEIAARAEAASTLPADARMDAYYYGFDRTGVDEIDAVLSAVAIAGKGSHHTESWGDSGDTWYYSGREGLPDAEGAAELIENTAQQSAHRLATLKADNRTLVAALKAVESVAAPTGDDYTFDLGYAAALDKVRNTIREALGA